MDPDLAPPTANQVVFNIDMNALVLHLHRTNPDLLQIFSFTPLPSNVISCEEPKEQVTPAPLLPSPCKRKMEESLETFQKTLADMSADLSAATTNRAARANREMTPTSTPLKTPTGPSAQPILIEDTEMSGHEDNFITVVSRNQKRKLKTPKSQADPPKKVTITEKTSSRSSHAKKPAQPTKESGDSNMEEPPRERVPPLYIREKTQWERLVPMLLSQDITFLHARSTAIGIRVQCPDSINHRRLTALLRSHNIGFHTYALQDERVLRAVIRGLPCELSSEHIKEDLIAQGFPVQAVHRMYNQRTKKPYDMVLVIADLAPISKEIFNISAVCRLSGLSVQEPWGKGKMGQCHNCMIYGHSARFCYAQPRCVKCLLSHSTSDCPRKQPTEEPPSCVLCGTQGHPANYRGCPKAPKEPWRRVKTTGSKRAPSASQKFVPAPQPETNYWTGQRNRPAPPPPPTTTRNDAAPAPKSDQAKKPTPVHPPPPPTKESETDSLSSNWQYVSYVIDNIDLDELDMFVQESRANPIKAAYKHSDLLRKVKSCRNYLNGLHTQ